MSVVVPAIETSCFDPNEGTTPYPRISGPPLALSTSAPAINCCAYQTNISPTAGNSHFCPIFLIPSQPSMQWKKQQLPKWQEIGEFPGSRDRLIGSSALFLTEIPIRVPGFSGNESYTQVSLASASVCNSCSGIRNKLRLTLFLSISE